MNKNVVSGLIGLIIGAVLMGVIIYSAAPGLMILEDESKYNFEESVAMIQDEAAKLGWKIPTVHDLQATMKKFGKDVNKVYVFELCHPDHAYKILSRDAERIVSSMMPCRVSVYERSDGKVYVSRMNSKLLGGMFGGVVSEVMADASQESEEILKPILK